MPLWFLIIGSFVSGPKYISGLLTFFNLLISVETNDAEYPYDMPGNQRKVSDFDDVRKEEDFDRLPEKRTKSDQLKGKCH